MRSPTPAELAVGFGRKCRPAPLPLGRLRFTPRNVRWTSQVLWVPGPVPLFEARTAGTGSAGQARPPRVMWRYLNVIGAKPDWLERLPESDRCVTLREPRPCVDRPAAGRRTRLALAGAEC